ncbi:MAG: BON domain-containing protein [Planctomycetes bacterium]|nr:BON domain-containing protein [Planctomycetota bacterium]
MNVQGKFLYFDAAQDRELENRVRRFLAGLHRHRLLKLEIEAKNGEVTVSGVLDTFYEKQIALSSCRRVAGVVTVNEKIEVGPPIA